MPEVCLNLPDEFDKLDAMIADLQRLVRRSTSLPPARRLALIAKLTRIEWGAVDCRRALHDVPPPPAPDRG